MRSPLLHSLTFVLAGVLVSLVCHGGVQAAEEGEEPSPRPPKVGDEAPDFKLQSLRGKEVELEKLTEKGPVVLVVLRGYPGYQCPICSRQVGNLMASARDFAEAGARVVFVYPGPSDELKMRAEEFVGERTLPDHFDILLDPDYEFTLAYALRWDEPRETAYPSTFVIGTDGKVRVARISKTHGGRTDAKAILQALHENADE